MKSKYEKSINRFKKILLSDSGLKSSYSKLDPTCRKTLDSLLFNNFKDSDSREYLYDLLSNDSLSFEDLKRKRLNKLRIYSKYIMPISD